MSFRSRQALPTLAIVLLTLGAQVATTAHWLLVRHERCEEHGVIIHADELHGPHADAPDHHALPTDAPGCRAAEKADHGHDHCDVALLLRERIDRPASDLTAHAPPSAHTALAQPATVADTRSPLPILAYAPKSSPPV
jgi:hypothetical protein